MSTTIEKARIVTGKSNVSEWTDEQLLLRYRKTGERELFDKLVRRYERELFSYLRRYLGDPEMAEDVFQATFLQLHLKCDQFSSGRKLRPWLYTIATNQAIDAQRRNRRHRMASLDRMISSHDDDTGKLLDLMASSDRTPFEKVDTEEERDWVRQALLGLPDHLKAVVTLVYYQGMKYREAAEALSIPVGTVKSRMHTAVLKLNETWNETHIHNK